MIDEGSDEGSLSEPFPARNANQEGERASRVERILTRKVSGMLWYDCFDCSHLVACFHRNRMHG